MVFFGSSFVYKVPEKCAIYVTGRRNGAISGKTRMVDECGRVGGLINLAVGFRSLKFKPGTW